MSCQNADRGLTVGGNCVSVSIQSHSWCDTCHLLKHIEAQWGWWILRWLITSLIWWGPLSARRGGPLRANVESVFNPRLTRPSMELPIICSEGLNSFGRSINSLNKTLCSPENLIPQFLKAVDNLEFNQQPDTLMMGAHYFDFNSRLLSSVWFVYALLCFASNADAKTCNRH